MYVDTYYCIHDVHPSSNSSSAKRSPLLNILRLPHRMPWWIVSCLHPPSFRERMFTSIYSWIKWQHDLRYKVSETKFLERFTPKIKRHPQNLRNPTIVDRRDKAPVWRLKGYLDLQLIIPPLTDHLFLLVTFARIRGLASALLERRWILKVFDEL